MNLCFRLTNVSCLNKDCIDCIALIKSQGLHNSVVQLFLKKSTETVEIQCSNGG